MDLKTWMRTQRRQYRMGIPAEQMDVWFVTMARLMEEAVKDAENRNRSYYYGQISIDAFSVDEQGNWSFGAGVNMVENYCPSDDSSTLASDIFALGMIYYEMLMGISYTDATGMMPGLSIDFEEIMENSLKENKTSFLDKSMLPEKYRGFGSLLEEMTQFRSKDRYQTFEEFPNGEYVVSYIDADNGTEIKSQEKFVTEGIHGSLQTERELQVNGCHYILAEESPKGLDYSFLRKEYKLLYRKAPLDILEDWS